MLDQLKLRARQLKQEVSIVAIAARDPRTPWYVKALIFFAVAHTLSPIDLVPDFIPVLGYLDDLIVMPGGLWLALRLISPEVMADARSAAATCNVDWKADKAGAMLVVSMWIIILAVLIFFFYTS